MNIKYVILIFLCSSILWSAEKKEDYQYSFSKNDNCYSFQGSFFIDAEPDSLLNLIYRKDRIIEYSHNVDSVDIIMEGNTWYDVAFHYKDFLIFKNYSVWRRSINKDDYTISFKMLTNKSNIKIIPDVISSEGCYRITSKNDSCKIEVVLKSCLKPGILKNFYYRKAEEEAVIFLKTFDMFLQKYTIK